MSDKLSFQLPLGLKDVTSGREITLLRTNGLAEKVFTQKNASSPYTWMAEVISIATRSIGQIEIGVSVRKEYESSGEINVPKSVLDLSLADANTLMIEIHRRVWQSNIPQQESICKYCGKPMIFDIDLFRITMDEGFQKRIDSGEDLHTIVVNLDEGFEFSAPQQYQSNEKGFEEFDGIIFNVFEFRTPTLRDAIQHEKSAEDSVMFWRKLATNCLTKVYRKEEDSVIELPFEVFKMYGLKLLNEMLFNDDLRNIRSSLRETVPTLTFGYSDECPCPSKRTVPVSFEPSSFFTD